MSIDGIRAVDKEPLAAVDYFFGMSVVDGRRVGPRPVGVLAASQQIAANLPLGNVKSYASVAAMNADVAPPAGTLAYAPRPGRDATEPGVRCPRWGIPSETCDGARSCTCPRGGLSPLESQAAPLPPGSAACRSDVPIILILT